MLKAGILGGSGYTGEELIRLLHIHPNVQVTKIISDTYKAQSFSYIYRNFKGIEETVCQEVNFDTLTDGLDIIFSALPYGVLMEQLTEELLNQARWIDIGVDYRWMNQQEYQTYYGKPHRSMHLASRFTYGLSEWNRRNIQMAEHIANPGCFATAIQMALLPLIQQNLIEKRVVIDGKCALSGSGRTLSLGTHFAEANESAKAYKVLSHPHTAESREGIRYFTNQQMEILFVPHIVPMQRGMLVTCYTTLTKAVTEEEIREVYLQRYQEEPFVRLLDPGMYVETKWVRNSNMVHLNLHLDPVTNTLIVVAALDNLIKGAAGQAIQNMNLMFGFPEESALDFIPTCI